MINRAAATAVVLSLISLLVPATGMAQSHNPAQRVAAGCEFLAAEHIVAVTVKRTKPVVPKDATKLEARKLRDRREGQAFIVREADGSIGVRGGPDAAPVDCLGGVPTLNNTDYVLVRRAAAVKRPSLAIDTRLGLLTPGFTDERDRTSEVEVFADLGRRATVVVAATSGADHVTVAPATEGDVVNLNANEAVRDPDVFAPHGSTVIYGGAGADLLEAVDAPEASGAGLIGGGGDDIIAGTANTDLLQGDGGADLIDAGGSSDIVYGLDRATDRINCGPGDDTFVIVDRADELSNCEGRSFEDPLAALARPLPRLGDATLDGRSLEQLDRFSRIR